MNVSRLLVTEIIVSTVRDLRVLNEKQQPLQFVHQGSAQGSHESPQPAPLRNWIQHKAAPSTGTGVQCTLIASTSLGTVEDIVLFRELQA